MFVPDQMQKERPHESPAPWSKPQSPFDGGPRVPNINKPDTSELLKKLKSVAPDQSRRYKQRSGQ